jgi:NAD(P)-dependent dehydrogenase (short-subunit alcohol dehydrogenase family)
MHYTASRLTAPLMIRRQRGLIVSTTFDDRGTYLGPPLSYDLQKTAVNRMAYGMSRELRPYNVAVMALSPGTARNEFMIDPEELLREYEIPPVIGIVCLEDAFDAVRWAGGGSAGGRSRGDGEVGAGFARGRACPRVWIYRYRRPVHSALSDRRRLSTQ